MPQPSPISWLLPALVTLSASAQVSPMPAVPPSAPKSAAVNRSAPEPYRSAFEGYQPFAEEKLLPWKDTNATVEKIGGWRAYAKEARQADSKAAPAAGTPASSDPHAGHGKR